jgi:hypothetical protein
MKKVDLEKMLKDIKQESDNVITNIAKKNLRERLREDRLSFDELSNYDKMDYIDDEKRRLKKKTKDTAIKFSLVSVASFLLFGF